MTQMINIFLIIFGLIGASSNIYQLKAEEGKASYYADHFEGKSTASGEKYWHNRLTAAHKTLPFGTRVNVTNLDNDKQVVVVINDRGPFIANRIIDLSKSAAEKLDFIQQGIANVSIEIVTNDSD